MATRRKALILSERQIKLALAFIRGTRYPTRNTVMMLLSHKQGLRAVEIASIRWYMFMDSDRALSGELRLEDWAAKMQSGRTLPLHKDVMAALQQLRDERDPKPTDPVVFSERNRALSPHSVVCWFAWLYGELGYNGASSHSGRRWFATNAANKINQAGGSLRDVQMLLGHKDLRTTQEYIDVIPDAAKRVMSLI